ncbi:MAG TPA: sugar kinase [Solirubrobacteraceae bacterium]
MSDSLSPGADVVGLGEVMLRFSPARGRRIENADALSVNAAGAEANVLGALARLGRRAALVTAFPDSPPGRRAAGELLAAGVDLAHARWIGGARMGTFYVELGVGARVTNVWYDRAGSAFARHVEWPSSALRGARYAVLSGITPALSVGARTAALAMIKEADQLGVPVCLDVNYRARLWSPEAAREALTALLGHAGIVVCSADDAVTLFDADPDDPAAFRARWAPRARVCAITHGERGAVAVGDDEAIIAVDAPATEIVDRLGLGDAFLAGLLHGLLEELPLMEALRAGAALAALKATVAGDLSLARREDLDAALARVEPSRVVR